MTLAGKLVLTGCVPLVIMFLVAVIGPDHAPDWEIVTQMTLFFVTAAFWTAAALVFIWREM